MKKKFWTFFVFVILLSCNSEDRFKKEFDNCLTNEQINLILQINSEFDEFVVERFKGQNEGLNEAYYFMTESITKKGGFSDYWYSNKKLLEIKNQLVQTGLFNNLNSQGSFRFDFDNGNYLKCLNTISKRNNDVEDALGVMFESNHYDLSLINLHLRILAEKKEIQSISKILMTFQFIIGQIEVITTANNV